VGQGRAELGRSQVAKGAAEKLQRLLVELKDWVEQAEEQAAGPPS